MCSFRKIIDVEEEMLGAEEEEEEEEEEESLPVTLSSSSSCVMEKVLLFLFRLGERRCILQPTRSCWQEAVVVPVGKITAAITAIVEGEMKRRDDRDSTEKIMVLL
jgi:hypothetical protein